MENKSRINPTPTSFDIANQFTNLKADQINTAQKQPRPNIDDFLSLIGEEMEPVRQMYADYKCAAMEVETKFKVLNERLSIRYDANPIESIKMRIKEPASIIRKLDVRGYPFTLQSIYDNLFDIAGVRVVCSFVDDVYMLADYLLEQDDITLVQKKDYIANPKESGYRSLHLIVQVPIFTEEGKKMMNVEVQLRTIAMDFWASLEHKMRYKKNLSQEQLDMLSKELQDCAQVSSQLDDRMQKVKRHLEQS